MDARYVFFIGLLAFILPTYVLVNACLSTIMKYGTIDVLVYSTFVVLCVFMVWLCLFLALGTEIHMYRMENKK